MATYTLKEIIQLFKDGKSLDAIVALEAYEASVSAGRLRGAMKESEARVRAARENGKKGGRPKKGARSAVPVHLYAGNPPEFVGTAKDFAGFRNLSKLPPGVKLGSDLEARS